jgi:DNA-binding NtrC family response regulator
MAGRILILDDEAKMADLLARSLERSGYEAVGVSDPLRALDELKSSRWDVLVTDLRMPGMDGLEILERSKSIDSGVDVILMTAYASIDTDREAMKRGAVDYLEKPVSAEQDLKPLLSRLLDSSSPRTEKEPATRREEAPSGFGPTATAVGFRGVLGNSPAMQEVARKALKVARTNSSVLLRGESGTGKEVLADYIQASSPRASKPYVKVNCGALPETLLESELFGHVKGSFTGATADREGLFAVANGGTILLDEIGEISPALQVKLLRILQQGEYNRVGDSQVRLVDVRVIAATNRPLERMFADGSFRQDLYYRLNVVPIVLPPLRERREDIGELIRHFAGRFQGVEPVFSAEAMKAMLQYPWPGNIRELENAVEHALVLGDATCIRLEDLPAAVQDQSRTEPALDAVAAVGSASLEEIEKRCLLQALEKTRGNRTRAAKILNITRRTLGYRLRKYDLEEEVNRMHGSERDE